MVLGCVCEQGMICLEINKIMIDVYSEDDLIETTSVSFLGSSGFN
jgi:hypothetical protein